MATEFEQLNHGWNAEPNAPDVTIQTDGTTLTLSFLANPFQYQEFNEGQIIKLKFTDVWRYGIGTINDEGWYGGQCRFSNAVRRWGEFYCVTGELLIDQFNADWHILSDMPPSNVNHFLFYFRDCNFECDAATWERTQ